MSEDSVDVPELPASSGGLATQRDSRSAPSSRPPGSRWTVIEQFEHGGFHYRISRKRIEATVGPQLTTREMEVLGYANRGYNNKLIATALGVAPSTVGVLLFRAASKVGAKSRHELLRAYARLEQNKKERR